MNEQIFSDLKDIAFDINVAMQIQRTGQKEIVQSILQLSKILMELPLEDRHQVRMKIESDELIISYEK